MRDATLHQVKLNGCYCVTFREVSEGGTESLSFHSYLAKQTVIREMSHFKLGDAWKELAK